MFGSRSSNLEDIAFKLKFTSKQLSRDANKCVKKESEERAKLKTALQKNQIENAKIYAENAIRQQNQRTRLLQMSAKMDAISSRVDLAAKTNQLTNNLKGVVKGMERAITDMDLEKVSSLMENFEKQFEDLDIKSNVMEGAMDNANTLYTPIAAVNSLMQEVADENGIELNMELPSAQSGTVASAEGASTSVPQDDLKERLARLRQI
ncbi:Charged multivesicular body protein 1b [Cichlidogyrus casuarinus]|uniref:Charged multivesicular body protein 1b n=1 Tax=Cichlidogyrus casuarinus TaxID=1844966 RepID=A0ABD2PJS6_9PLAT